MTDSELPEKASADRAKVAQVIRRRPKVGPVMGLFMSVVFALIATPLVSLDLLLTGADVPAFVPGEPAPMTIRVPQFSGFSDDRYEVSQGAVVVARGQEVDRATADLVHAVRAQSPDPLPAMLAYFGILLAVALVYTTHLRRSHRGRLLRTQAVTLLLLLAGALAVKLALMFTALSLFAVPLACIALVATLVVDLTAGLLTALTASVLMGLLVPFDLSVAAVLLVQSAVPALVVGERHHKNAHILGAGLASGAGAALAYAAFFYLSTGQSPIVELAAPLRSGLWAAAAGGVLGAILAIPGQPLYQYLLGDITKGKLVELEDLSNPLLKQIASNSPGTWQHSLAMANMAEIAANAIGANGRLVRVGAYYHDLGKSLQSKYFIENLEAGESSPHDRLPPEVSCDAIFAHVTEGVRLARKHGLPERIIDFMHMHHGDGLLEYFWTKCQESGNPKKLTAEAFRYPGLPPQSRETAILAIVDAVEAASRTLKKPDERAIETLVQRIVYGKLHLGQLDQSGLSMADLRKISNSLRETIKHAHHGRIEYPWQREAKKQEEAAQQQPVEPVAAVAASATQRIIAEPRLDSLDTPRPYWRERPRATTHESIEIAATEQISLDTGNPPQNVATGTSQTALPTQPVPETVTMPVESSPPAARVAPEVDHGQAIGASIGTSIGQGTPSMGNGQLVPVARPGSQPAAASTQPPAPEPSLPRKKEPAEVLRELVESVRREEPVTRTAEPGAAGDIGAPDAPRGEIADGEESKPLAVGMMVFGPPPATRPNGDRTTRPVRAATGSGRISADEEDGGEGPIVEPASPAASMLPPRRARTSSGKPE